MSHLLLSLSPYRHETASIESIEVSDESDNFKSKDEDERLDDESSDEERAAHLADEQCNSDHDER